MTAVLAVRIGHDVHLFAAPHRDGDVVEREAGQGYAQQDSRRVGAVNLQRRFWRF